MQALNYLRNPAVWACIQGCRWHLKQYTSSCIGLIAHRERTLWKAPEDLLFEVSRGVPYREQFVLDVLQEAAEEAGLGHVTWHDFRHAVSTRLHHLRHAGKTIQNILGHARLETTMNIYTHGIPEAEADAIDALERELFPDRSQVAGAGKETKS